MGSPGPALYPALVAAAWSLPRASLCLYPGVGTSCSDLRLLFRRGLIGAIRPGDGSFRNSPSTHTHTPGNALPSSKKCPCASQSIAPPALASIVWPTLLLALAQRQQCWHVGAGWCSCISSAVIGLKLAASISPRQGLDCALKVRSSTQ